ncbi:hypothetical protein ACPXCE_06785 [Streptomyces sp. DT24]|uniref:hypothetical protein n=1 Tax=unclassified Streptomyces TaxID=2593676 RepID=UPI0023B9AB69|nr:hypothetical protein [Streptomyces sp. AM 4-1-1]WEH35444.1 hypothetical protein PZB75_20030 [Streptomyces sp. AM 4-1-1]
MSQPVPPPNQPQPQESYGAPTGNPFAAQQGQPGQPGVPGQPGQFGGPVPFAPAPAPARDNIALGLVTALVAAVVGAILYGVIGGAIEREIGYLAIGVGFLVGFASAKVGGPKPVLPVVGAVLSLGAVYLGQLIAISMVVSDKLSVSFTDIFFDRFSAVTDAWSESADVKTYIFLVLGAAAAFAGAKKAA